MEYSSWIVDISIVVAYVNKLVIVLICYLSKYYYFYLCTATTALRMFSAVVFILLNKVTEAK